MHKVPWKRGTFIKRVFMYKRTDEHQAKISASLKEHHRLKREGKMETQEIRNDFQDDFQIQKNLDYKIEAAALAFNEELLDVEILENDNPHAEQVIELGVNGVSQFMMRGKKQTIKRKFVESLARAKTESISTPIYKDATGADATKIVKTQGLRYPFKVTKDANPRGQEWLEAILRERA